MDAVENDELLTAEECVALVEEITGKALTVAAWRRYVASKTKTNPAPDAAPMKKDGRVVWFSSTVRRWAENRPGTGTRELPSVPGLWDARECAEEVGISEGAWNNAVAEKTQTNPAPDPVPASKVPEAQQWRRFWLPADVLTWAQNRPGYGNWKPRVLDESKLKRNEWTTARCADEAGVTEATWLKWVHDPDSGAPQPIRQIDGRWWVWHAPVVRRYLRSKK
ncbi:MULTISPECIES: hypothetical protein [unclassified Nocardia]|uniref:hypothetical protein n=1 Tax=unclassified Nocardia TaxID=2637762 RepID=UPI00278C329B|nr:MULTISPECIES: hypothetical protein [unclassified Nocardia]